MRKTRRERILTTFVVASFLWSTLLIAIPGNIYLSNIDGFNLHFRDLIFFSLPLFCAFTICSTVILLLTAGAVSMLADYGAQDNVVMGQKLGGLT